MNTRNLTLWSCIIAAGTTHANADIFTWFANSGMWENPAMWNGPAGQYPDSILDTATVSGISANAQLTQNLAIGTLNVINGAEVFSSGYSIFVNADTMISGLGSSISVTQTPSLRDFDTDTLTITDGFLSMYSGLAQFDEALILDGAGTVLGAGTIEMNSTTGNIELGDRGTLWAVGGSGPSDTFLITRTDSSTSKLDWTHANSSIRVWESKTMINEIPYTGSLGGKIYISSVSGDAGFESTHGFIAAANSEINFSGNDVNNTARLVAPFLDSYGEIFVSGTGLMSAPIVALRGEITIETDSRLQSNAGLLNFHSIEISSPGANGVFQHSSTRGTINFKDGDSTISMGVGSRFDLDGYGETTINIEADASVWLEAEYLDYGTDSPYNGTLNIDGSLHVEAVNGRNTWTNAGEIYLDGGEIAGRMLVNDGIIQGTGSIEGYVTNNGEIIADGGTLQFGFVSMDGSGDPGTGILRAQTGDLVMNLQADGATQNFTGSIFVGDGAGIREVLNADVNLVLRDTNGTRGSMQLNSGFVVLEDFLSYADVTIDGESLLRVTGTNGADRITFSTGSTTTINGTLEADGNTWFVEDAQVNGSGAIDIVSTNKGIYFQNGADLGGVSLLSSGGIYLTDTFESLASVHALTMRDTALLNMSIYCSDFQQQTINDKLTVADHANLDGTLVLKNFPQTDLPTGVTVTILEAASISGEFDSIDDSGLGFNRRAFVTIDSDSVEVFITCSADLNADGGADFFDVSMFMALFNSNDPAADLDGSGDLSFFDVSLFLSAYESGCQ